MVADAAAALHEQQLSLQHRESLSQQAQRAQAQGRAAAEFVAHALTDPTEKRYACESEGICAQSCARESDATKPSLSRSRSQTKAKAKPKIKPAMNAYMFYQKANLSQRANSELQGIEPDFAQHSRLAARAHNDIA